MNPMFGFIQSSLLMAALPTWTGKAAFIGAFVLLVVVLVLLPPRLAGETGRVVPWWRRVRLWAVVVALIQIAIYACWG
ncbi:MAG: hypothetical protein KJ072_01660 [Verrucomicrobia bacterium]|nr:hypothetical protein [Verrucomicrobiota bacterium]